MDFKRTLKQQSALARLPQIAIFLFRIIYSTMWYSIYQCIIQCCLTFQAPKHSSKNEWGMRFVFCLTSKQLSAFSLLHSKCAKKNRMQYKNPNFFLIIYLVLDTYVYIQIVAQCFRKKCSSYQPNKKYRKHGSFFF